MVGTHSFSFGQLGVSSAYSKKPCPRIENPSLLKYTGGGEAIFLKQEEVGRFSADLDVYGWKGEQATCWSLNSLSVFPGSSVAGSEEPAPAPTPY